MSKSQGRVDDRLCTLDTTDLPESWKGNKPPMAVSKNLVVTLDIHYPKASAASSTT